MLRSEIVKRKLLQNYFPERGLQYLLSCWVLRKLYTEEHNSYSWVVWFKPVNFFKARMGCFMFCFLMVWWGSIMKTKETAKRRILQLSSQTWPWSRGEVQIDVLFYPLDTMSRALVIGNHVMVLWLWSDLKFCFYTVRSGHNGVFHQSNNQVVSSQLSEGHQN